MLLIISTDVNKSVGLNDITSCFHGDFVCSAPTEFKVSPTGFTGDKESDTT